MKFVLFYHSLVSDWNHGNAHFLRGIATELIARGHVVTILEPAGGWSLTNLLEEHGEEPIREWANAYPDLRSRFYDPETLEVDQVVSDADVVIVHEWNNHDLVRRIGEHRHRIGGYTLLFHDTHHRSVTKREDMARYDLRHYDGVLAYGEIIREIYLSEGWTDHAWTWHEAADVRVFRPMPNVSKRRDLVWIGNWGDEERTRELMEFLIQPVRHLRIGARVHGVRYPEEAVRELRNAGIEFRGWLANFLVPRALAEARVTVHVPRRPYVENLPGIPTIRPFEAMACGIPLIMSPWEDAEGLFRRGKDYLMAKDGLEMESLLRDVLNDRSLAQSLAKNGRKRILERHTCAHRVDELMEILTELGAVPARLAAAIH